MNKTKELTTNLEENTVYWKDYYSNAEAYAHALVDVLKAKTRDPEAIKANLKFLVNALGFDLVERDTGEINTSDLNDEKE